MKTDNIAGRPDDADPTASPNAADESTAADVDQAVAHGTRDATLHADKYNDPRARVTRRGVVVAIAITLVAAVAAMASIYARRTRLERTTAFFDPVTIEALQLAETIDLIPQVSESAVTGFPPVIPLTATPGLGHLRRAILDDRHYDWSRTQDVTALDQCDDQTYGEKEIPGCVRLRLSDPTLKRFEPIEIDIDLIRGWIGRSDRDQRVAVTDYVRPKLQSYFATIINVSRLTYDARNDS